MSMKRLLRVIGLGALAAALVACSDSKTDAKNDDVKAIREIMEKNEAEKAASVEASNKKLAEYNRHRQEGFSKLAQPAASKPEPASQAK